MELWSDNFVEGGAIPSALAFARQDPDLHVALSDNRSPHLAWAGAPEGTLSYCLFCIDQDAPAVGDDVNVEGLTICAEALRCDFVHWVMIDIPLVTQSLSEGACGSGVTPGGKASPVGPPGARQGINDYTSWFKGDLGMAGTYMGYDGPAPPWNDEALHRYVFEVHALDVGRLPVVGQFGLPEVRKAMQGHVLATAQLMGTYTLNPDIPS